ncbi:unnamed protein product (macronuclear) [Paramecium tetraurelia]|uniref:Uncharacterized protein n=1 Tax=Paramecium tetraurelia TaxID=5888 RepID=A0D7V4_PARTE|nr:uncharacterized protein GSPATT00014088001 [Paramecium tetraurelia]CAK79121.1 unnamed protein product [Paramecium tetraurelia]|eukprot:XP_001446518.1 hypothetical protein (macronuclear) [Paramecium tetraurelia strain d4-2]
MNQYERVFKESWIMIIITLLIMFQSIFGDGSLIITIIILGIQILCVMMGFISQTQKYSIHFEMFQQWTLLFALYISSKSNAMSILALCSLKEFFICKINTQLPSLNKYQIIHQIGSDLLLFIIILLEDYNQVYLSATTIMVHWLILFHISKAKLVTKHTISSTQQEINDKIMIDSVGNTQNHSRLKFKEKPSHNESPTIERDNRLEILSIFPQGIGLIKITDKKIELEYHNENLLKLSMAEQSDQILSSLFCLEQQSIQEDQQKQQNDYKNSMSSFSTFQQTPIPCNLISKASRNEKRSQTNKLQSSHKLELFRQNSALSNIEYKGVILRKCDTLEESILEQELRLISSQMRKVDFQNYMKNQNQLIQEHVVILGYQKGQDGKKNRTIEVKLYNALIVDVPYILMLIRDITHRDYIHQLRDYSKQKSKTLSFVSHEYRTPLNCIIDMLEQEVDDDQKYSSQTMIMEKDIRRSTKQNNPIKMAKQIKIALDHAKYLQNLSDDLLDLAQIKVGKFKINKAKFNFNQLLETCVDLFQVMAERKQIKLYINYESKAPRYICSDPSRLKQIMINLLGNAFKFTEDGSVTIKVAQVNLRLEISVVDTGIGMTEEDQLRIFQAFGKGNSEEHKKMNKSGVGLGLLISNQILQNLNQDLQNGLKFKSQYKKGSTFYFQIQYQDINEIKSLNSMEERNQDSEESIIMQQQQEESIHKVYVNNQASIFKRSTKAIMTTQIMIVDDVCMNIDMLKRRLAQMQYKIIIIRGQDHIDSATNGYLAIEKCSKKWQANQDYYKLIFMDLEMPTINGIQTTKKILELSQKYGIDVKIIGCSAYESLEQKQECLNAGMKDYITKPIQLQDLNRIVQQYL